MTAQFAKGQFELVLDLIQHLAGNANATAISDGFEACCDIDSVAEYVAVVRDDVPNIDANTKIYSMLRWCIRIALSHSALDFYSAPYRVNRACKLDQHDAQSQRPTASVDPDQALGPEVEAPETDGE